MIKAGTHVKAARTFNLSVCEDESSPLVIREGDTLIAENDTGASGFQLFTHLPSQFANIQLHRNDVRL